MAYQGDSFESSKTPTINRMTCKVLYAGGLSETSTVNTGVKQGCLVAPFLFLLAIDRIMKETTESSEWDPVELGGATR